MRAAGGAEPGLAGGPPMTIRMRCDELPLLWPPKRAANRGKYELMRDGVQLSFWTGALISSTFFLMCNRHD